MKLSIRALFLAHVSLAFAGVGFTLTPPISQTTPQGGIPNTNCVNGTLSCVLFSGVITPDPSVDTYLNAIQITFTPSNPGLVGNSNFFFANVPGLLASTDAAYSGATFEIDIASNVPAGSYQGTATLLGGTNGPADLSPLVAVNFTVTVTGLPQPALSISKTHTGDFTQGQQNAQYTLTVSNGATAGSTNGTLVTVTDTAPSGLTINSMIGTGWTCVGNNCTRNDVLTGGASYPAIAVTVNVSANAASPQVNAASVSGGGSANANTTDSTTVVPLLPDLTITKSHTGNFTQGQTGATYTIVVSNNGAGATSAPVTVTDTVPAGLTATSITGSLWNCTQPAGPCTRIDTLAAGANYPAITLTVNVASNAAASVVNSATVSGGGETNTSNDTATDPTTIGAAPSFTLGATAASVAAGASGSSTVTVNPANGFNSAVTLATSGWPAGITGTFGTNPTTGTSMVTITVGAGVAVGPYTLTVNGSGGGVSASTTIALNVTQGSGGLLPYGVSVTPAAGSGAFGVAQNLTAVWASPAGQPALSWGSLLIQDSLVATPTPANACLLRVVTSGGVQLGDDTGALSGGYAWVGYSWTISPSNTHCQLNGPQSSVVTLNGANEQVTLNLQFNQAWAGKTLSIWMQGTNTSYQSGAWQQLGTFAVTTGSGPSFTLGATAASVAAGASGSSTVTVNPVNGFNSAVTLAASGWPSGITGAFGTNPTTGTSMVTINVGSGVAVGPYTLTVNGSGGGVNASTTIALNVTQGAGGGGGTLPYGVSVTPSAGSGAAGVGQNLTAVWASPVGQPALSWGSLLIQDSSVATPTLANACYLRVVTTGGVQLGDDTGALSGGYAWVGYTWTISPSNAHCQLNGPQSSVVTVNGANEQVTLNLQFNPAWAGKTLSIWMQGTNTSYQSGAWQQLGTFTVTSGSGPSFTLGATAASAAAGASGSSTVTVSPVNGFNSAVTLATSGWPAGITGTFGTNPTTNSSSVTINVGSGVAAGPYTLTVNGSGGGVNASTTIALTVTSGPSYTLSATAASVAAGASGSSTVTVNPVNGFNSAVTLATSGWPSGITGTFGTNPTTGTSMVTINVGSGVAAGPYTLTVNGSGGGVNASTTIALTVTQGAGGGGGTLPYGVSVTPSAGSGAVGVAQNLTAVWASPAGQPALTWGSLLIQDSAVATPTLTNACYLRVVTTGGVQLGDDTGALSGGYAWVGYSWAISPSNTHCQLNGPQSSVVTVNGANEQVTLNLQFNPAWAGKTLSIWMQGTNTNYQSGTWQQMGTFAVTTGSGPSFTLGATAASVAAGASGSSTVTVSPVNGFNSAVTLTTSGWPAGITGAFGTNPTTGTSMVTITVGAGVAVGPYTLTVNGSGGGVSASTTIALTVTAGSGGGGTLPYGVSVTPSAGSGAAGVAQNLTAVWASPAGQPALTWGSLLIQDSAVSTPTPANACLLRVVTTGGVQLGDDTGALSGGYSWVGYSWTISPSNAHCQLNGPQSSVVTVSGANEQVTLNLQFNPAWAGKTLSIWMQGTNTSYQSGAWQQLGTFVVQ